MPRMISFSATKPQFIDGSKTVTRRTGWKSLKSGDILCAVEKAMGLKKGETVKRLGLIRVVSVRREPVSAILPADVAAEGFPNMLREDFIDFYCKLNKCKPSDLCARIEFVRIATDDDRVERSHG